jgi:hypothetical protein
MKLFACLVLLCVMLGGLLAGCTAPTAPALEGDPSTEVAAKVPAARGEAGVEEEFEGCSPGFWKNHPEDWAATGLSPDQTVGSLYRGANRFPDLAASTLLEALQFGGGPGDEGAAKTLLRQAVAAALNALHPDITSSWPYPMLVTEVNRTLQQNRDAMLGLADHLDEKNNFGCPL